MKQKAFLLETTELDSLVNYLVGYQSFSHESHSKNMTSLIYAEVNQFGAFLASFHLNIMVSPDELLVEMISFFEQSDSSAATAAMKYDRLFARNIRDFCRAGTIHFRELRAYEVLEWKEGLLEKQKKLWFEKLMGFPEVNGEQVRSKIQLDGDKLHSQANGKSYYCGNFETPSLAELRQQIDLMKYRERIKIEEVLGNVMELHTDPENNGALFQVASQFNCLEMTSPEGVPEDGVGIYEFDLTQGPACAIACGAATIYRNYFVPLIDQLGQSKFYQIDCLEDIGYALDNANSNLWTMKNGYVSSTASKLKRLSQMIEALSETAYDDLMAKLRIGVQWNAEVTLAPGTNRVSQAFCSALPVSYSALESHRWQTFARLILFGAYEATLLAALQNFEKTGCRKVFLTYLGGGAFGNEAVWIYGAMLQALKKFYATPLEVYLVSHSQPSGIAKQLIDQFS